MVKGNSQCKCPEVSTGLTLWKNEKRNRRNWEVSTGLTNWIQSSWRQNQVRKVKTSSLCRPCKGLAFTMSEMGVLGRVLAQIESLAVLLRLNCRKGHRLKQGEQLGGLCNIPGK